MKKRIVRSLFVFIVLIAVFLLVVTVRGAEFTPSLDQNSRAEITVAGSYKNFEALEAIFDGFNEYYPEVELRYVLLDSYNANIGVALSGEEAPNIFFMQPWMVSRDEYKPLLEAAEDLSDPDFGIGLENVRHGLLYVREDGSVPLLPIFTTAYGILVNEEIFRKEGLEVPSTYSELIEVTEKLKAAGYPSPMMGFNSNMQASNILTYTDIVSRLQNQPEALEKLNALAPDAGEALRPTLEFLKDVIDRGMIDLEYCADIENDYQGLILRFFEGDVPMMLANGDTVSGTLKRQALSEAFTAHPFSYSFHVLPSTDDGLYFLNPGAIFFAVNKNCAEPEMTNEFMRFLSCTESLNKMAQIKRMITPTNDFSLDDIYASLGSIDEAHTINNWSVNLLDDALIQIRGVMFAVYNGEMTIDEAIAAYGTF